MARDVKDIRSVAIVAHSGAGKTSLLEAILYLTGSNTRLGKVDDGTSMCDYHDDEVQRKITISAKALTTTHKDKEIFLIDTPGYADFIGEVISALKAVDSAVVVIDATAGVEVGTERVWKMLDKENLPRLIFINKLNKENSQFNEIIEEIRKSFGKHCVAVQYPQGLAADYQGSISLSEADKLSGEDKQKAEKLKEALTESVAETDDSLLEKYLEEGKLSEADMKPAFAKAVSVGKLVPIFCGVALKEKSVKELLAAIVDYLPSPDLREPKSGTDPKSSEPKSLPPKADSAFSAQVFKTILDPYVGQLTIFRVYSGTLASNTGFFNSSKSAKERIGQIYHLQAKEQKAVDKVIAGEIAAVAKLKITHTGDTLCDEKSPLVYKTFDYPEPAISSSVKPKSRSDEEKISGALTKLTNEDLTFKINRNAQTKELIISGVGDLHLTVMVKRLKARFGVDVDLGTPKVAYRETVTKTVKVQGKHKKQSGGRGQYADVWLEIEPLPQGSDFEFADKVFGGAVPKNYIPSVEKGVKNAMAEGAIAGYPLVSLKVTIYDGSYHDVDSSDIAFQIAGAMALRKGVLQASPVLLEPVMDVEVTVSDEYMGQVSGDLSSRRGRIMGVDVRAGMEVIKAQIPLAEMFKYATELRSMTQGKGSYTMRFADYEQVPHKIAQTVIDKLKKEKEEAEKK